jgi:hypothetical protein
MEEILVGEVTEVVDEVLSSARHPAKGVRS